VLLGRESECEAIDGLLDAAKASRSGSLVLRGEAGIGKSALLDRKAVAAPLYVGPKTVEYHARKVFTKLGIASRTELIRLDLDEQAGAQQLA
jgi:AAA ATPase domain/Bacterial regulatory proteins, luxR family